jgi:hypothetical protein
MEAEYLAACLSLAAGCSVYDRPELMPAALRDGLLLWRHLQMIARVLGLEDKPLADPARVIAHLPEAMRPANLFAAMEETARDISALIDEHIIKASGLGAAALERWEEVAVRVA